MVGDLVQAGPPVIANSRALISGVNSAQSIHRLLHGLGLRDGSPQTIELFTHVISGITINIIPDKEPKYRTVRSNTGRLATLPWAQRP